MVTDVFIFRHSNRMDRSKNKKEQDKWLNSERYMENPWDSPLSKFGIKNTKKMVDRLMKHTNVTRV
jgi:hypothetical protein